MFFIAGTIGSTKQVWRYALIIIIAAIVAMSGVYLGRTVFSSSKIDAMYLSWAIHPDALASSSLYENHLQFNRDEGRFPTFDLGASFPDIKVTGLDSACVQLSTEIGDARTILLFVDLQCEPCIDLLQLWADDVSQSVDESVLTVLCMPHTSRPLIYEETVNISQARILFVDETMFTSEYNLVSWPTIVVLGDDRIIEAMQLGFPGRIHYEVLQGCLAEGR